MILAVILAGFTALACSSGGDGDEAPDSGDGSTRKASAGGIEVEVEWLGSDDALGEELAGYPLERFFLIEVRLDTHSGDLGSIDMAEAARLLAGGDSRTPEEWVATSDDAHHRSGVLVFRRKAVAGPVALTLELEGESAEFGWDEAPG